MYGLPNRSGSPRLPWKRGPVAWKVSCRADEILCELARCPCLFLSLRRAAHFLGVSTQPLRDWILRKDLKRDASRRKISKDELCRFVKLLHECAEPFDPKSYMERLHRRRNRPPRPFDKLRSARFVWPKGRTALKPKELAAIIGCHRSFIVQAIHQHRVRARRWKPCRWEISRNAWDEAFAGSLIKEKRWPALPQSELIPTAEVARHLKECGMDGIEQLGVCNLIKEGLLEALHQSPIGRKWYVTKASLKEFRKTVQKNC